MKKIIDKVFSNEVIDHVDMPKNQYVLHSTGSWMLTKLYSSLMCKVKKKKFT